MGSRLAPAASVAKWQSPDTLWLDHAILTEGDLEWLAPVRRLTLWAVKTPPLFLSRLPLLDWLDVRGGSGNDLDLLMGCTRLRYLAVNQIRGVEDLSCLASMTSVELLSLYGLPRARLIPSLERLYDLRRAQVGSMKGLSGLTGLLDAPVRQELQLQSAVGLAADDAETLASLPTLTHFDWLAEGVPDKVWVPVRDRVDLPRTQAMLPQDWFAPRAGDWLHPPPRSRYAPNPRGLDTAATTPED